MHDEEHDRGTDDEPSPPEGDETAKEPGNGTAEAEDASSDDSGAAEGDQGDSAAGSAPPWVPTPPQVYRYRDAAAMADAAAKRFVDCAKRAVAKNDRFVVVLSGGSTPRTLYVNLTQPPYRQAVPWAKTYFVFGDERCVPPDHDDSNYRMARETLLDALEIPEVRVLRMKGEQVPAEAARRYEVRLNDLFLNRRNRQFDLVLLGIGTDGHTASLFPGTAALDEQQRWTVANHVPKLDAWRLTLTFPALNSAQRVLFLAAGPDKAKIVAEAFEGAEHPEPHPCERIAPRAGRCEVLLAE